MIWAEGILYHETALKSWSFLVKLHFVKDGKKKTSPKKRSYEKVGKVIEKTKFCLWEKAFYGFNF